MSKELEVFSCIKQDLDYFQPKDLVCVNRKEQYEIIENALKNYVELTNKPVMLYGRTRGYTNALIDMISKNFKEVKITNLDDEKKLKALEIIKKKMVNVCAFISWNNVVDFAYEKYVDLEYTYLISAKRLTKEDFDILKEVLL